MIDVVVDGLTMVYDRMEDRKIVVIDFQSIQNWCSRIGLLSSLEKNDFVTDLYHGQLLNCTTRSYEILKGSETK